MQNISDYFNRKERDRERERDSKKNILNRSNHA